MKNDRIVYLISEGEYSDYRVVAAFTSEKLRDEYMLLLAEDENYRCDGFRRETLPLNPRKEKMSESRVLIDIDKEGNVLRVYKDKVNIDVPRWGDPLFGFQRYNTNSRNVQVPYMTWGCETDDEKRAIKVANEKRAMIVASDAWLNYQKTRELLGMGGKDEND